MTTLFQRHCSDESLISHLDGELPFYRKGRVRRHLERCWPCRLRLSEIEAQVLEVTRAMEQDVFPGPDRIADARLRFLNQADRVAEEVASARNRPGFLTVGRLAWAAAAVAALCLPFVWKGTREAAPSVATETFKRVEVAAVEAARHPVHQRFRVVARQIRPEAKIHESRLETWSEPGPGRYTSRFNDGQGVLQLAVWQPAPDRQYIYRASRSKDVMRVSRQQVNEGWGGGLLREGMTLEDLEAELLTWLEKRPWRPVSLSYPASVLVSADGASVEVEEKPAGARPGVVRLRVRKSSGAVTVEFTLDVDRGSYAAELQCVRYESQARVLELQLYSEPAQALAPVSFEPPVTAPVIPPLALDARPSPVQPAAPVWDSALFEAEIYHALHRVRACLGETIEVRAEPDGTFAVRGAVVDESRKDQILAALAPLQGPRMKLEIKSAQELLREIQPSTLTTGERPAPHLSHRADTIKSLSRHFAGSLRETEEFAERASSAGEGMMKDAQALRQLAERFGGRGATASRKERWLLEVMAYDHLKDLEAKVESTRQLLVPLLGSSIPAAPAASGTVARWDAGLNHVFSQAKALNESLRSLFIAGDAAQSEDLLTRDIRDSLLSLQASVRAASDHALTAQSTHD